ncbi:MAG: patatin-like phospholipase family protein [Treponema sp.]|nr:patatin-like phospholipase family protein [Treponema sp.]
MSIRIHKDMKKHPWALVLSGGGAKGLAHIGVLRALEDAGFPKPSLVAGTSMGAIVGGLYACGMSPQSIERFVDEEFDITDYLDSFVFKIQGPVGKVFQTGQILASLATSSGIDTGQRTLELLERLTQGKMFNETEIAFRCNALDLLSGAEVVFRSGSIAKAMRASMSFPVFFEPFVDNGMCLVDGGLLDNMPVAIARSEGFTKVLAVDVNRFILQEIKDFKNGPQVIFRSIECALNATEDKKIPADITLNVTSDATPFSFFQYKKHIALGKQTVVESMEKLKVFFETVH